jgi:hypothetical protein
MYLFVVPLALFALTGETPADPVPPFTSEAVTPLWQPYVGNAQRCRELDLPANTYRGNPPVLDRGPASPGEGQLIYAVDHRINGCSVIVAAGMADIRRLLERVERRPDFTPEELGK